MAAVLIHGYNSGPKVWEPLQSLATADPDLESVDFIRFEYATRHFRWSPIAVIPDLEAISQSLETELRLRVPADRPFVLVGHSQGGLVALRYIANLLEDGRGYDLRRLAGVTLFACPVNGSAFLLPLRRLLLRGNSQARRLEPLNGFIARTQRVVAQRALFADQVTQSTCPILIQAYAGTEDGVVSGGSAHWIIPETGRLPGTHSGIIGATSHSDSSYLALKDGLCAALKRTRILIDPQPSGLGRPEPGSMRLRGEVARTLGASQVPPGPLVGRQEEIAEVIRALSRSSDGPRAVLITGRAGIGKSRLVMHVASLQRDRFPDGEIQVGINSTPEEAGASDAALEVILGSLGVPLDRMPPTPALRRALYQSLITSRAVLIVIEDLSDLSTLGALTPEVGRSAIIATSRNALAVDAGECMTVLRLGPLDDSASMSLLRAGTRPDTVGDKSVDDWRDITRACGNIPANLNLMSHLLSELGPPHLNELLPKLEYGRESMTTSEPSRRTQDEREAAIFEVALAQLADEARSALNALALLPRTSYGRWLFDLLPHARSGGPRFLIEQLSSLGLLMEVDNGRYLLPEMVHRLARERVIDTGDTQETVVTVSKLYSAYSARARYCRALLEPERPPFGGATLHQSVERGGEFGIEDAGAWLAAEQGALALLMSAAAERGFLEDLKVIANSLPTYQIISGRWVDWIDGIEAAARAAENGGDLRMLAYGLQTLANLQRTLGHGTGRPLIQRSHDLFVETSDVEGQAYTLNDLGLVKMYDGEWQAALKDLARSEEMLLSLGNAHLAAHPVRNGGITRLEMGDPKGAIDVLTRASEVFKAHNDVRWGAYTLGDIAKALRLHGRTEESRETFTRTIRMLDDIQDKRWAAVTRLRLADLSRIMERSGDAAILCSEAANSFKELDDSLWEARALVGLGLADVAVDPINRGLETFRLLGSDIDVCWALVSKYRILRDKDLAEAERAWAEAARIAILRGRDSSLLERFLKDEGPDVR